MKRKVTEDEIAIFLQKCADQIKSEMDFDLRVAESRMHHSKKDLMETFDENQKKLYKQYIIDKHAYYRLIEEYIDMQNKS